MPRGRRGSTRTSPREAAALRVRKAHPTWGLKKILATLDRERPDEQWPARTTIDAILKRSGVVAARSRRPVTVASPEWGRLLCGHLGQARVLDRPTGAGHEFF